jgi:predicted AAA+ superfamily ATPase
LSVCLENVVYLELFRRGYKVYTWTDRNNECEIDFVIEKDNNLVYLQVCWELNDKNYERESKSLFKQKDGFQKIILCYENIASIKNDGIRIINLIDWLLDDNKLWVI